MATSAKMSFNYYQNGKYGTLPGNPTAEVSQDMHLKMSKKIAQLTKVIYALNTKNDEHESVIQTLKEQHEEHIQQLLSETRQKITLFKQKLDEETDYRNKISQLEANISEHERHRKEMFDRFETFKRQAEQKEANLKMEHSQRYLGLSQDVLTAKKTFEEQLSKFGDWQKEKDLEKEKALEELKVVHEKELEELRNFNRTQGNDWLNECAKIEDKYKTEIEQLKVQCEGHVTDKQKMSEDYEAKLNKAQSFYEKELEALRNSADSSDSLAASFKQEQEKLKKGFAAERSELKKQIQSLVDQLSVSEESVTKYKNELQQMQEKMSEKDSTSAGLYQQLQDAKQEANDALRKLKELESELVATKDRCKEQADDLLKMSKHVGELEGTNIQKTGKIKELEDEIKKLKDRLSWLESERKSVESEKNSSYEQQMAQIKSLERSLEDMSIEKQTIIQRLERELESLKEKSNKKEKELNDKHAEAIEQMETLHKENIEKEKVQAEADLYQAKQQLTKQHLQDIEQLTTEKTALIAEFEKVKNELSEKLAVAESEVRRLEGLIKQSENGLGTASSTINGLKDATHRLQSELDKTREELKNSKTNAASLKIDLDKVKSLHENKMKEAKHELKTKLDQLSSDLESKWSETLRKQCAQLKQELTQQKEDEKKAALQQLAKLKDDEIAASKKGWETIVSELHKQIEGLKVMLSNTESTTASEVERLRREAEAERLKLEQQIAAAAEEFSAKMSAIQENHAQEIKHVIDEKAQEAKKLENELVSKHMTDMQAHLAAHKSTIEIVKAEAIKTKETELQEQKQEHHKEIENVKENLYEVHSHEIDTLNRTHENQMEAARMELERAVEISKQRDKDFAMQIEELQSEIAQRDRHIHNLQEEIKKLQAQIDKLTREIDGKNNEIVKTKNDASLQIRKKEEVMNKQHQRVIENLKEDFTQESQAMMSEFTEAQELLKDKISELQIVLEESEERYNNRDSRPEDLELIQQLRDAVQEREQRMKQLIDEKRYYQLELVNRETNFNKVFNTQQNVGVINPLAKKNKKSDRSAPTKHSSQPNLNGTHRLDPLPNSPMHAENLNPTKPLPLPAFTKKFVR